MKTVSTHHYLADPELDRCRAPGLHGAVCGLPRNNRHHKVPPIDPAIAAAEARRLGEHE